MPSTVEVEQQVLLSLRAVPLPPGARVLVAWSGGPDSTALLAALVRLRARGGPEVTAAYLDHGLRPEEERAAELAHVRAVAGSLGVELAVKSLPAGLLRREARRQGRSLEEAAREARYAFLSEEAEARGCPFIAVGHTADDHLETVLMRFFQGAGPAGLAGIPPRRGSVIRPLLGLSREAVHRWLESTGVPWRLDSSNSSEEHLRNALRARLVPVLAGLFPGWRGAVASLAGRQKLYQLFAEQEAERRLEWEEVPGGYRLELERFLQAPGLLRVLAVYRLFGRPGLRARRRPAVPFRFLAPLLEDGYVRGRGVLLRGYGLRLARRGRHLVAARDIVGCGKKGYLVVIESGQTCRVGEVTLRLSLVPASTVGGIRGIPSSRVIPPLVVRSRKPGDQIRERMGTKTIKKLFGEWRVPAGSRWRIPVLADRLGVLAVLGQPLGYSNRFREGVDPGLLAIQADSDGVVEEA